MSLSLSSIGRLTARIIAGCERLVHPDESDPRIRAAQSKFIATVLSVPFIAGATLCFAMPAIFGPALTAAAICAIFGLSWTLALLTAWRRDLTLPSMIAIGLGGCLAAFTIAISGGLSSPMSLLAAFPAFQSWLVRDQARRMLRFGIAISLSAFAAAGLASATGILGGVPQPWHWLPVSAFALLAGLQLAARENGRGHGLYAPGIDLSAATEDMVLLAMSRDGDVADVTGTLDVLGADDAALLTGNGFFERIHVADRVGYLCALAEVRETGSRRTATIRLRLPERRHDGAANRHHPFEIRLAPAAGGALMATLHDDSRNAALRAALELERTRADSTEVTKKRFLATVSHELRTPLNAIIGFSDMMSQGIVGEFSDPRQREYVALIGESGNHLLSVVNAILDVSKIESGAYSVTVEPFGVGDAVGLCMSMISAQAEAKGIALTSHVARSVGEIKADRRAVQQMLLNLLSNAVKFTPAGGHVRIEATRVGRMMNLKVSDDGIGIASEDLNRLGEPFTQVQNDLTRHFDGTGLGLSIVKGLVKLHHGTMSIESAPGAGTCVSICLPVSGPGLEDGGKVSVLHNPANEAIEEVKDGSFRKIA